MDHLQELSQLEPIIREAGQLLREIAARPLDVLSTEGKDIKLQADRDSEALIMNALREHSPHPILGEESGEHGTNFDGPFWVIDPLDGTLNYSRGNPVCCVSIALMDGETPQVAAIYDFNRDELFTAAAGHGAWRNGRPMRVSKISDAAQGVLSTGFPSHADYSTEALLPLVKQVQSFKKVRMIGAAAVSLAWVACGRMDAYAEDGVMLWDVAAGILLVKEAGGDIAMAPWGQKKWSRRVRAASNAAIWPEG